MKVGEDLHQRQKVLAAGAGKAGKVAQSTGMQGMVMVVVRGSSRRFALRLSGMYGASRCVHSRPSGRLQWSPR